MIRFRTSREEGRSGSEEIISVGCYESLGSWDRVFIRCRGHATRVASGPIHTGRFADVAGFVHWIFPATVSAISAQLDGWRSMVGCSNLVVLDRGDFRAHVRLDLDPGSKPVRFVSPISERGGGRGESRTAVL